MYVEVLLLDAIVELLAVSGGPGLEESGFYWDCWLSSKAIAA